MKGRGKGKKKSGTIKLEADTIQINREGDYSAKKKDKRILVAKKLDII
jgi:hypothetical protein